MSFRRRLTTFFALIVVVPMIAIGAMVFRLIAQSENGKVDALATGLATVAENVYANQSAAAKRDAERIARDVALLRGETLVRRVAVIQRRAGLARVTVSRGSMPPITAGRRDAVAPGIATARVRGLSPTVVEASQVTAGDYVREISGPGVEVVVRAGPTIVASSFPARGRRSLPSTGTVSIHGANYRAVTTERLVAFRGPLRVTVFSSLSSSASSVTETRLLAGATIVVFLLLAFLFAILASRQLQGQITSFLHAARRLGEGDFSSPVPVEGNDDFAALGDEFNRMSRQLATRIEELAQERVRLRTSIRRIGETFASNLDRQALLELALSTAVDAVRAEFGRVTARKVPDEPLSQALQVGSLHGVEEAVLDAERSALASGDIGDAGGDGVAVAASLVASFENGAPHAVLAVGRRGPPFTDAERDVLRSLSSQAALALENVELHFQVSRQAVTDELTGLANHRLFQEMLGHEIEQVRRYRHSVGLIMIDIDNFKSINDTFGHPQGDVVLQMVGQVLRDSSREVDVPARYGGEEMALILPHTDLDGAHAIAERFRSSIEALPIPRLDGNGELNVTVSVGVAAAATGDKESLIADADAALYTAKRAGKNRTVTAQPQTANVFGGE